MYIEIKPGFVLRFLARGDADKISNYFQSLGPESKRRFQPHPLTPEFSALICKESEPTALRSVVECSGRIVAYFILEGEMSENEAGRYDHHGIQLQSGEDYLFAPSVADNYQNLGVASAAMPHLLSVARDLGARSLVLMGGTQATNAQAIGFYEKFGFKRFGGYQTDVFNHDMRVMIDPNTAAAP
jgi:diamine N-acetyltransferase